MLNHRQSSLPLTVSESHHLSDVQKGEGMELDQLLQNASRLRQRNACIYPFDLDLLRDAFHMRETTPVYQPFAEKGIPTATIELKSD
ncbi:mediator of RNA polymerase II transcription subunit 19a [Ziziphus jujuba]|uniref:Mediator of RNA polymerase II transcription subunit 19a n=1 Tax=Ziziphus jujuba TaxID=326968 RepID=A0A6P6FR01_ZIZJJ|nr:mediator of RNA polymerase II transcription subunit 19a [Ziziphus jujuba]